MLFVRKVEFRNHIVVIFTQHKDITTKQSDLSISYHRIIYLLDMPFVRVLNLNESATDEDVKKLFYPIGPVKNVILALDTRNKDINNSGFAFVDMVCPVDADRAIKELDGTIFRELILKLDRL